MYNHNIAVSKNRKYCFSIPSKKEKNENQKHVYVNRNVEGRRSNYAKFWLEPTESRDKGSKNDISLCGFESGDLDSDEIKEVKDLILIHKDRLVSQWDEFYGGRGNDVDLIEL